MHHFLINVLYYFIPIIVKVSTILFIFCCLILQLMW